ncbi:alpha-mannosidase [bacterium]|nr:alpha-mannosidase [bacterium]
MFHEIRFTREKIARFLAIIEQLVYRRKSPLPPFRFLQRPDPMADPLAGTDVDDSGWEIIEPETYWGEWVMNFTLRSSFTVPSEWESGAPAALYLPLGDAGDFSHPEALAYVDGVPYASCDRHHREIMLPVQWRDGASHVLALNGWTGLGGDFIKSTEKTRLFMRPCSVVLIDTVTRDFIAAARVALGAVNALDANSPVRFCLLNSLNDAFRVLDMREPIGDRFYGSVGNAYEVLRRGIENAGAPLDADITATGHSHIDVAWLWTLGQTRRKVGRTFHTVLRLMEQFPGYHFTQSQPQLYDYMRRDYPDLFEDVKERVREGRWEVIGGMWVEADCNISGPESLARQFLLGRTFFRRHFGSDAESPVLWLPDVFGYSWSLPQLIKEAGLEYFFTIKISWNQYNRLPYDTFWWQGLDGTRVLTHFSTSPDLGATQLGQFMSTYNANAAPAQVLGTWKNFQQKELGQELLMAYGYGDGGGGPTREMLENIREMEAFPGMPRMNQKHVGKFYRKLEAEKGAELPVWNGELYFELHRGTYTSQSRNKKANRESEFLLHDAEFLAVLASLSDKNYLYPAEDIRQAWELVCLNQFHDIIPGSSINEVYKESLEQYAEVKRIAGTVRDKAAGVISCAAGGDVIVINPSSFRRSDPAFIVRNTLHGKGLRRKDGTPVMIQQFADGIRADCGELEPYSVNALYRDERESMPGETGLSAFPELLENNYIRVEFDRNGDITRIYDKVCGREVLPAGAAANVFQAFEDRPVEWEAWDVFIYYDDKMWLSEPASSVRVVENGPLRATIEIRRQILSSPYVQRISLNYNSPRLDFETSVDWRERHVLLKVAFPVDILSPVATCEIQWGNVERPTHRNTSWDWARFETCAQKWVDLSEGGYGVSILNNCKYGHDIRDNVIRVSLLRSPCNPDPEADKGEHRFTYSLFPHEGRWDEHTIAEAYSLNDPLIALVPEKTSVKTTGVNHPKSPIKPGEALVRVDRPSVVIETVKAAEDGDGIIVRLYESRRTRGDIILTAGFGIAGAWRTNLLEENRHPLKTDGNRVFLSVKPYEILTLRIVPIR